MCVIPSTQYFVCHAAMGGYIVATMRNFSDANLVYKLLQPYFHYTIGINCAGSKSLINDGGIIDKILPLEESGKWANLDSIQGL